MNPARLIVALALPFLLAACQPEAHIYLGTKPDGSADILVATLSLLDLLPLLTFATAMAALVIQPFIPALRRLSTAAFRFGLKRIGKKQLLEESARLLASGMAWLGFTCGLCLFPLVFALYGDTFRPHYAGPFNFGQTLFGAFFSLVLMAAASLIATLWTFISWQLLHRVGKKNPLASRVAAHVRRAGMCMLPILVLLLVLPACKPDVRSLRNAASDDSYIPAFFDSEEKAELRELIEQYLETGDARLVSPRHHFTMLHFAAGTQRYWLVNKLLAEGADPNARMQREWYPNVVEQGDTPAMLAVRAGQSKSNQDALLIVQALCEQGADPNIVGFNRDDILEACNNEYSYPYSNKPMACGGELALELMKLGATPNEKTAPDFIRHGWQQALEYLLPRLNLRKEMPALLQASASSFRADKGQMECAQLLLERATAEEVRGTKESSPLFTLCKEMAVDGSRSHYSYGEEYARYIQQLLSKGADLLLPGGEFGMSCAADYLAAHGIVRGELQNIGIAVDAPPHRFAAETAVEQLLDIPTQVIREEEVRQHYEAIASLFAAPTEAMLAHKLLYRQACSKALKLLHQADAQRTQRLLMAHPAWHDPACWQGDAHTARALLYALQQNTQAPRQKQTTKELEPSQPLLPADFLLEAARSMEQAGKPAVAHAFTRLLGCDEGATALVDQLCEDENTPLPLRAAAWSCRLQLHDLKRDHVREKSPMGLPPLGTIETWLEKEHYIDREIEDYPILHRAVIAEKSARSISDEAPLIKPERFFYEPDDSKTHFSAPTEEEERAHTIAALRQLGAPLAARLCGDPAPAEPEAAVAAMQERCGMVTAASLELEIAISRYMLKHRDAFREPREHRNEDDAEKLSGIPARREIKTPGRPGNAARTE